MSNVLRNQSGIVNIDDYDYLKIAIIGCGSIGSYTALGLNRMGFKNIMLIDDDKVEKHNYSTQYYDMQDVKNYKTNALKSKLRGNIVSINKKLLPKNKIEADVIFVCVDSLKQRKVIAKSILDSFDTYKDKPVLLIDGRMHRLVYRVFTINLSQSDAVDRYVKSMMGKGFTGSCTEKGIMQNVFAVVSVMLEQFKKCMNGEPFPEIVNGDIENYTYINTNSKWKNE